MIVIVPLPCELNASMVAGLNTAPSDPPRPPTFAVLSTEYGPALYCAGWANRTDAHSATAAPSAKQARRMSFLL
jgi:hypothetical protein